jgi:outer membrane lipoprotein carrier protein
LNAGWSFAADPFPPLLRKIEDKYSKAGTLIAHFNQINESSTFKTKKESQGYISIRRPNEVRWETQSPDESIFISDGTTLYFYTPPFDPKEHGQLVIRKTAEYQSKFASGLLSGSLSSVKGLKIKAKGKNTFVLTPAAGTSADVKTAEITVDPEKLLIIEVKLELEGGNKTDVQLSQITLGKSVGSDIFRFRPPPGTDIVEQ